MKKFGTGIASEPAIYIFLGIFVIGVVLFGVSTAFGDANVFADFFDFLSKDDNQSFSNSNYLGLVLGEELRLHAFVGAEDFNGVWEPISDESEMFAIGTRQFETSLTRLAFFNYYFQTLRKPQLLDFYSGAYHQPAFTVEGDLTSEWLIAGSPNDLNAPSGLPGTYVSYHDLLIVESTKPPYQGDDFKYFRVGFDRLYQSNINKDDKGLISIVEYQKQYDKVENWRNQILENGEFEKFLELEYTPTLDGNTVNKIKEKFRVKKVRKDEGGTPVIYIELDKAIKDEQDKYGTEYVAPQEKSYENTASLAIDFDLQNGVEGLLWGVPESDPEKVSGWYVLAEDGKYYTLLQEQAGDFFTTEPVEFLNFFQGLKHIVPKLQPTRTFLRIAYYKNDYDNIVVKIYSEEFPDGMEIYSNEQVDSGSEQDEMIVIMLDAYNAEFKVVEAIIEEEI